MPAEVWRKFLAAEPGDRFATVDEASVAIEPFTRSARRLTRRAWLGAAGGLVASAVGAAVVFRPRARLSGEVVTLSGPEPVAPPAGPPIGKLPLTPDEARALQRGWADHTRRPPVLPGPLGMTFALIPPGTFGLSTECRVTVSRPYSLGTREVTVGQFRTFVESTKYVTQAEETGKGGCLFVYKPHPSGSPDRPRVVTAEMRPDLIWRTPGYPVVTDAHPVTQVSWRDAERFCRWLGERFGGTYRLPSEAEWVWAARCGSAVGPDSDPGAAPPTDSAWWASNSKNQPQPVGTLKPNAWGLFDTVGNVGEWCLDWHAELPVGTFTDWRGPETPDARERHVFIDTSYISIKTPIHDRHRSNSAAAHIGFRVLREAD
jgi:formylglycine-generating enzyme